MALPVLDSAERAYRFWGGDYSVLPILDSLFRNILYPFVGMLAVGNSVGDALVGGLISSAALQAYIYTYVYTDYDNIKLELDASDKKYIGVLSSGKDAIQYVWGGDWRNLVNPALMRMPIFMAGSASMGNNVWQVLLSSAIATTFMEWAVVDHTKRKLELINN